MGLATFRGGVHPYEGKELSMNQPVEVLMPGKELVYPLAQHIGAPANPVVAKGDRVLVGQIIAESSAFISANVISSVSGTVKDITPRLTASGALCKSIVVENDGAYETVPGFGEKRDPKTLSKEQIRQIVKDAGIVGMGGAGFPTHVKLTPKNEDAIDTIIVNGAECEPYLTSDYRMMLEEPDKIVAGLKVILQLFPQARGVIAIENNKPEAIRVLQEKTAGEEKITVCPLKTKYPQGGERMLIDAVTHRRINSSMLPADAGVIVDNVDTVIAIYMAVCESTPLIRRIITVTGDAVASPRNFSVRTGTNYRDLIEAAGGFKTEPEKILSGGPMMGQALFTLDIPVAKTSSTLTCFTKDAVSEFEPTACIRCGRCVSACPEFLVPQKMMAACEAGDLAAFEALSGMECCECGSCTFVCPARRRLTQTFKEARKSVMAARRKAKG